MVTLEINQNLTKADAIHAMEGVVEAAERGADCYSPEDRQEVMGFVMLLRTAVENAVVHPS